MNKFWQDTLLHIQKGSLSGAVGCDISLLSSVLYFNYKLRAARCRERFPLGVLCPEGKTKWKFFKRCYDVEELPVNVFMYKYIYLDCGQ